MEINQKTTDNGVEHQQQQNRPVQTRTPALHIPHGETHPEDNQAAQNKPQKSRHKHSDTWWLRGNIIAQTIFSFCLVVVGAIQIHVYRKQAATMNRQLADTEAQLRAFLRVVNPVMTPHDAGGRWLNKGDPAIAGWLVSPGWENVGLSLATHVQYGFDLKWFPRSGKESTEQLIADCPPGSALTDYPHFAGFTVAPGRDNGIVAPAKELPFAVAEAAARNQMIIVFVMDATYQEAFDSSAVRHSYVCVGVFVNDAASSKFSFVNLRAEGD